MNTYFDTIPEELIYSILQYLDYISLIKVNKVIKFNWEDFFKFVEPILYRDILNVFKVNESLEVDGIWSLFYKNLLQIQKEYEIYNFSQIYSLSQIMKKELEYILHTYDRTFIEIIYNINVNKNHPHFYKYYFKLIGEGVESILAIEWLNTVGGFLDDINLYISKGFDLNVYSNPITLRSSRDMLMIFLLYHDTPEFNISMGRYKELLQSEYEYVGEIYSFLYGNCKTIHKRICKMYGL